MTAAEPPHGAHHHATGTGIDRAHRRVIFASSLGTVFEGYDFYLYGALSAIIAKPFFSGVNETTGVLFALLVTMVCGPIAAWLDEPFPSQTRYTSVSLPHHIGNG